jgi:bifunctional UDP-N-acetylglucosamine pyrophosphorylase / glucosamine-1-phosphate N-acetyltransferase
MNKLSIIILAAGAGTRMKSKLPKVLHKISGREMLYYSIKEANKLSDDIHIVLFNQHELVKSSMEKYFDGINFHIQDFLNLPGTGGAVMGITPKYDRVLVLNGDMPLIEAQELSKLNFASKDIPIVMTVLELQNADGYGRVIIENSNVKKIVEQKDCNEDEIKVNSANAGIYCFDKEFLLSHLPLLSNQNAQKEYYITDLVEMAINKGLKVAPISVNEENFKGVNSKFDLSQAEVIHQNRIKKAFMANGITMRLPDTIYIEEDVEIEGDSVLENGVTLLGKTKIISSHIKTNSIVESSIIKNSDIGPMARIRPDSRVESSHIGNFVEVKKSNLFEVKAGHLSYLGDSEIDSGTNVGAGTITCNYDGVNKYKTKIGKNVFIGSDTQLVAPLEIPDNVMIAAGSTVTKNPKSGDLVLSRTPQKSLAGFFDKFFGKKGN